MGAKITLDEILHEISRYVVEKKIESEEAFETARLALIDSLGCALLALQFPECTKLLGPLLPGTVVPFGCRVPGTQFVLDPVRGAFNIGTMIRWLDFNDTWLAAEWGHPSDNIGGLLAVADHLSQHALADGRRSLTVRDLLEAMIKAYEIQGVLALSNSFNRIGFDHVILVKAATAAVAARLFGENAELIASTLSHAFIDTGPLRTYRHAPNTGSRKSWAAGDATRRGVELAMITRLGEMGYPKALTAKRWGFNDCMLPLDLSHPLGSTVMENILFKVSFPAEFHAQTAVECAFALHPKVIHRLDQIERIQIETHESALRIIDKKGPLSNPADRDHCLQYMVAVALLKGSLNASDYEEAAAQDMRIDTLRKKMDVREEPRYSKDYLDPEKRSIANAIQISFKDGSRTDRIEVEVPLGHRRRRAEAKPLIFEKAKKNFAAHLPKPRAEALYKIMDPLPQIDTLPVKDFVDLFI